MKPIQLPWSPGADGPPRRQAERVQVVLVHKNGQVNGGGALGKVKHLLLGRRPGRSSRTPTRSARCVSHAPAATTTVSATSVGPSVWTRTVPHRHSRPMWPVGFPGARPTLPARGLPCLMTMVDTGR